MPRVLCGEAGSAGHSSRGVLPDDDGGIPGGDRLGAGHCLAVCGLDFAAGVSGIRTGEEPAGAFEPVEDAQAPGCGSARGGVRPGAGGAEGVGPAERQDAGGRLDDAGGERGDALDRASRRREGLRGVAGGGGAGLGDRDADAGRPGEAGPEADRRRARTRTGCIPATRRPGSRR